MKLYEVIMQDEWDNLTLLGFYKNLDDSIDDINSFLTTYGVEIKKGDVHEYAGTLESVFDTNIGDLLENEELCGVMVRGFILDEEDLKPQKKEEA